ncbi:MAG: M24 family metallopeptidase [Burkholderiales bacterium]
MDNQIPSSRHCDPISTQELERRWAAARNAMRSSGIDALVMQGAQDFMGGYVRWFADQPALMGYPRTIIFPQEGLMTICDVGPFNGEANPNGKDPEARGVGRRVFTPSFNATVHYTARYDAELVVKEIRRNGFKTVGLLCADGTYHGMIDGIRSQLNDVEFVDASEIIDQIKAIKSPEEMEGIRRAAAMQDQIMAKVREHIRPGMKEFEVSAYAQYVGQLLGSQQGIFLCSAAEPGRPAQFRYRFQQSRTIQKGDAFTLLVENNGPGGFYTELCRVFTLGPAPAELKDALAVCLEAQQHTLKQLVPGASCAEIFASHNAFMRAHGLNEEKRIHCHGQGYELVERPLIRQDESMTVKEHMHLAVHPVILNERIFMTNTDNYLIGPQGPLPCLHQTPQAIIEVV